MSRSYRMRYHTTPPNLLIVDPTHVPIEITVKMMNGKDHILLTERNGETLLDVKYALLPYVVPISRLPQLVFRSMNYEAVDDGETVSSLASHNRLELHLLRKELPTQIIISAMSDVYTIIAENGDETFLDIKRSLLPRLPYHDDQTQIIFVSENYDAIDDDALVSSLASNNVVKLHVFTNNP